MCPQTSVENLTEPPAASGQKRKQIANDEDDIDTVIDTGSERRSRTITPNKKQRKRRSLSEGAIECHPLLDEDDVPSFKFELSVPAGTTIKV